MTEDKYVPLLDADALPKRSVFNLSLQLGPKATKQTSIGMVYLYSLRTSDISEFKKLKADDPTERMREFLPCIASLSETSSLEEEREALPLELAAKLTEADLDALATAYASPSMLRAARVDSNERSVPPRQDGETATTYLDRMLQQEIKNHTEERKKMLENIPASGSRIFDQVRKSSSILGSTLTDYKRLSQTIAAPVLEAPRSLEFSNHMAEHHALLARERAEELEMVRLTGQMTAQSATTLRDLAKAGTVLLERLDERDQKSDVDTRRQLRIAVGSVIVSAVLALIALVVSVASFYENKANNAAGTKWQEQMLSSLADGNRQLTAAEAENRQLKSRVGELGVQVSRLSATKRSQPVDAAAKSATSHDRRATSLGKATPAP